MTVADIIAKRRLRWSEKHDIKFDEQLVSAAVTKILSEKELRDEIIDKPYLLIEVAFYIVDKKRETVPFFFNEVQEDFIKKLETLGTNKPFFVLKGRQQGFTSLITAIQLSYAIVRKNFSGFTIADRSDNTMAIFNDKCRTVYDRLPELLKPHEKFNSRNELFFDKLNSSWRIATATDEVGRSRTLNFVHFSEVAFYQCSIANLQKSIGEAITSDAIKIYESTANGFNEAKELWDSGSCHNLFYEWWRSAEYQSTEYEYLDVSDSFIDERKKWLEDKGLTREQITWYCKKYRSYLDKNTIKQEYPCTPLEAFISSGNCIFDKESINAQMNRVCGLQDQIRGEFVYKRVATPINRNESGISDVIWSIVDIEFVPREDGCITIHERPEVVRNEKKEIVGRVPYAIGGDTAGSGEDYFTAKVINNMTGKTVATLHKQRIDEDIYAEQVYCLGRYYHDAIIGIETNYSSHPMRVIAQKYEYPTIYLRERLDRLTAKAEQIAGFETTARTKPIILGELVEKMRENPTLEVDMDTLKEMTIFVKKENGKQEAIDGGHDDLVMALAIAHFVGKQYTHELLSPIAEVPDTWLEEHFHIENDNGGNESYMSWEEY